MFEFVCERIIPGCEYRDQAQKEEELLQRAVDHYNLHHTTHHLNEPIDETLKSLGMQFIRPA